MYIIDPKQNIEIGSDKPKLDALIGEVNEALTDLSGYFTSCQDSYDFWHSRWPGQTVDGRKHSYATGDEAWPWENASDTAVRMGEHFVDQYVGLKRRVFMQARWQATALRPMTSPNGREANQVTTLLKWMIYTHMRSEVLREIPLAFAWQGGYGASAIRVGWEQEQRVEEHELSLQILEEFVGQLTQGQNPQGQPALPGPNPMMMHLLDAIQNPAQEDQMISLLQQLSPLITKTIGGSILDKLRAGESATVTVPYTFMNKPSWVARRFGVDLVIPVGARDLQKARFIGESEWVSETELQNRVLTQDYDPAFVTELLKHRGEAENESWIALNAGERSLYSKGGFIGRPWPSYEFRNLFQLLHVHYKATDQYDHRKVYTTIFAPSLLRQKGSTKQLYATHGECSYEHGQYPFIPLRYETLDCAILSSQSIPHKVKTWEDEIKTQRDGRTDLTALALRPPIIIPFMRQEMVKKNPLPGATLALTRADLVKWMDPPQQPTTSVEIEQNNLQWAREFMGRFGTDVDPEWKQTVRSNDSDNTVSEMVLLGEMTLDLMRQYELDPEVADVVGPLQRPFHVDRQTLLQKHYLQIAFDPRMLNEDGVEQIAKIASTLLPFDRNGTTDLNGFYKALMQSALPDYADQFIQDGGQATQRETDDEQNAITAAMAGVDKPVPAHGNFQLRLQVIAQTMQNPQIQAELKGKPVSQEILKKRIQYYTNQIQQYQVNPQIGRTLATSATQPNQPIQTTTMSGALGQ